MSIYSNLNKINEELKSELSLKNKNQVPSLEKIVLNVGVGSYLTKGKTSLDDVIENIAAISGQKPLIIKAKLAVSNFKLRKGMSNGVKVTLRGERMYNFLDKLNNLVIPRIMDFRGLSKKFDKKGQYSIGIKDITIFNEINLEDISKTHGLQINFSINNASKENSFALLSKMGLPFKK
ncbi:50S ribosomal protein L5 [Candidatus Gracilibacteria bacterium]|nr:50S ribosomal protein L5 [Candidatus Gracilibacteria bacterium]